MITMPKDGNIYSSLIDAPVNTELVLLQVTNSHVEKWAETYGAVSRGKDHSP